MRAAVRARSVSGVRWSSAASVPGRSPDQADSQGALDTDRSMGREAGRTAMGL